MTAQIAAYGRLVFEPRTIQTRTDKPMTAARLAVAMEVYGGDDDTDATLWLDVLAFGRTAETLARSNKGDSVSVAGKLRLTRFKTSDGEDRETWQCIADSVITARSVRPSGRKRQRNGEHKAEPTATNNPEPFDDAIKF